jgi:hypothetical protein
MIRSVKRVSKGACGGREQAPLRQRGEGYLMSKMAQTKRREKDSATNSNQWLFNCGICILLSVASILMMFVIIKFAQTEVN